MYIRLSREDGDKQESESVTNQRKILQRYINENNLNLVKEYVDDGISGTTFDRPKLNEMLEDIQNKTINMVITKDLSRLGRDYIKTGFYIEDYFPKNNIRYVAITDGIDTYIDSTNNDITPFKAIMNDMYAKDISKKIRSVYKEKQKQGEYICSIPPYGYKKHPKIKNKLIIDNQTRYVVEKIFEMYANGHGSKEIIRYLNSNNYLSPTGYRKTGLIQAKSFTNYKWNEVTICNILKNEVYIGNTIQNKKTVISYKVKKVRNVEKIKQIRVNSTHEPIVSQCLFEKVQSILEKRGANTKLKHDYLLRGTLYCKQCKRKLQIVLKKGSSKNAKEHPYIVCSNAKSRGCEPININYEKFEENIIYAIKKICQTYVNKEKLYSIYEDLKNKRSETQETNNKKIEQIVRTILEINNNLAQMYMDKLKGILQEEDYIRISQKLNLERNKLNEQKKELMAKSIEAEEKPQLQNDQKEIQTIVNEFLKFENITQLYIYRLIDKIEIDKNKTIYIYFNFSRPELVNEKVELIFKDYIENYFL